MARKIKSFDRTNITTVIEEAEAALAKVAKKYGVTLERQRGNYNDSRLNVKFAFVAVSKTGAPADFARNAKLLGLPDDSFGKTFKSGGRTFEITGLNMRRRKYPISASSGGKNYKFEPLTVVTALRLATA